MKGSFSFTKITIDTHDEVVRMVAYRVQENGAGPNEMGVRTYVLTI